MTSDDKKLIYNLLKKADSYYYGYTRDIFKQEPVFSDDKILETIESNKSTVILEHKNEAGQKNLESAPGKPKNCRRRDDSNLSGYRNGGLFC